MPDNRAELIISARDEYTAVLNKMAAGTGAARQEITGLQGAAQSASGSLGTMQAQAQSLGNMVRTALAFAGITIGLYELAQGVKSFGLSCLESGGRAEILKGSMLALGQVYGLSEQALTTYVSRLREMGIPTAEATKAVNAFIKTGLEIDKLVPLAQAAKDIAATTGKSTQEVFGALVESIQRGMPRALGTVGIGVADMMKLGMGGIKDLENEVGLSLPEKAKVIYDLVINYARQFEGVSESVAGSYVKQQDRVRLAAEDAKIALFDALKPLATAITGEKIQVWEDLYGAISRNKEGLNNLAVSVGVFVERTVAAVGAVTSFVAAHTELTKAILTVYTTYKVLLAVQGMLAPATTAHTAAVVANTAAMAANTIALAGNAAAQGAALGKTLLVANAYGVVTREIVLSNAALAATGPAAAGAAVGLAATGAAAATATPLWAALAGKIGLAVAALAAYMVYKTFPMPDASAEGGLAVLGGYAEAPAPAGPKGPLTDPNSDLERQKKFTELQVKSQIEAAAKLRQEQLKDTGLQTGTTKGAGLEAAQRSLENFIQTMRQQTAQAAGDSMAALDEWLNKESKNLDRLEEKTGESFDARQALGAAYNSKRQKLEEDFTLFVGKESGNAYAAIEADANKWLAKVGGDIDKIKQISAIKDRKDSEEDVKRQTERLGLEKGMQDALAQSLPALDQQLAAKGRALDLEIQIGHWTLEKKLKELEIAGIVSAAQADEYRGLQGLVDQAKRFNQEREKWATEGPVGWAQAWAFDRLSAQAKQGMDEFKSMMDRSESWLGQTFGQALLDSLLHKKTDLTKIWTDILGTAVQEMMKMNLRAVYNLFARLIGGDQQGAAGGTAGALKGGLGGAQVGVPGSSLRPGWDAGSGVVPNQGEGSFSAFNWNEALGKWVKVAEKNEGAGQQLDLAGAAGIAAAGGMALAGIGVLTGSQFLQTAGMALMMAATALQIAAAISSFFHAGGIVAHRGLIVPAYAHAGLAMDERLIVAQTGEGILPRASMARLGRGRFEALRTGDFDMADRGGGNGQHQHRGHPYSPALRAPDQRIWRPTNWCAPG